MSTRLLAHSPDLIRLREEGHEVDVRDGHVVVTSVPYVTALREVALGALAIPLTTSGGTGAPPNHTAYWIGEEPCHADGSPISRIQAGAGPHHLAPGLTASWQFA